MKNRKNRKRIYNRKNSGSVTVEACFVVPLFLFFMIAMADIMMLLMAEAHIHQSLAEAAGYVAQYAYLEERVAGGKEKIKVSSGREFISNGKHVDNVWFDSAILIKQFRAYIGEDCYVESMISGGKNGIILTIKEDAENPKIFEAEAHYYGRFKECLLGGMSIPLSNRIRQKAFVGYSKEEQDPDPYVYVTTEQSVYHTRRSCTHLSLSIHSVGSSRKDSYIPCGFCGTQKESDGTIYVSRTSNVYHNNPKCSGLKRTVIRVKRSKVEGLDPCSRCGRQCTS